MTVSTGCGVAVAVVVAAAATGFSKLDFLLFCCFSFLVGFGVESTSPTIFMSTVVGTETFATSGVDSTCLGPEWILSLVSTAAVSSCTGRGCCAGLDLLFFAFGLALSCDGWGGCCGTTLAAASGVATTGVTLAITTGTTVAEITGAEVVAATSGAEGLSVDCLIARDFFFDDAEVTGAGTAMDWTLDGSTIVRTVSETSGVGADFFSLIAFWRLLRGS